MESLEIVSVTRHGGLILSFKNNIWLHDVKIVWNGLITTSTWLVAVIISCMIYFSLPLFWIILITATLLTILFSMINDSVKSFRINKDRGWYKIRKCCNTSRIDYLYSIPPRCPQYKNCEEGKVND